MTIAKLLVLCFGITAGLQAQVPVIRAIVHAASGEARLAPGVPANLVYRTARPFDLKDAAILVSGRSVKLFDIEEDGETLTFQVPPDLPLETALVVLRVNGSESEPVLIKPTQYAPGILPPARTNPVDFPIDCSTAAKPREEISLFAAGIGDARELAVTAGSQALTILDVSPAPEFRVPGFVRIRFIAPIEEGLQLISLSVAGQRSNLRELPLGRTIRNLTSASFMPGPAAPDSIETLVGCNGAVVSNVKAPEVIAAKVPDLSLELGGVTVSIRDSAGAVRTAPLYAVSDRQINYWIPPDTALGIATVTLRLAGTLVGSAYLEVKDSAPSILLGRVLVRVRDGVQKSEVSPAWDVEFGPEDERLFLTMFGTGFRRVVGNAEITAAAGGVRLPISFAGPQGFYPGLDQINVELPRELKGRGLVGLEVRIGGTPVIHQVPAIQFK